MFNLDALINNLCHPGFHVIDDFLELPDYQMLFDTLQTQHKVGQFKPAQIGNGLKKTQNTLIRNDEIAWLDLSSHQEIVQVYLDKLDTMCRLLNESLYLGLVEHEAHFAVYPPGGFYKKHVDQFLSKKTRRISCVYYLNQRWLPSSGGELILYDQTDQQLATIMPIGNRFVCFNSELPHEVCATSETRYSITAWLKSRATYDHHQMN